MDEANIIHVNDLSVHFKLRRQKLLEKPKTLYAVDNVSFFIPRGKTFGLVGESGCGKTTTGLALLKLVMPTDGNVLFDGIDLLALNRKSFHTMRRKMQIIFQDPYSSLNPRQTAGDAVREPLDIQRVGTPKERRDRVSQLFSLVGLSSHQQGLFPHQFSGGQRQRVSIARALALNPDFIVCDEPVSALDVAIQAQILNLLSKLQIELGLTYLFVSHDLSVIQHVCDEIAVMYLGKIVEKTNHYMLFNNPLHPYTKALISAVPFWGSKRERVERIRLKGDVPSPINRPSGCHFHPRCIEAQERCRIDEPILTEKQPGQWVACHDEF